MAKRARFEDLDFANSYFSENKKEETKDTTKESNETQVDLSKESTTTVTTTVPNEQNGTEEIKEVENTVLNDEKTSENTTIQEELVYINVTIDGETIEKCDLVYSEDKIYYGKPEIFTFYPDESLRLPLKEGSDREEIKQSIIQNGQTNPVICVIRDGKLIVLSGHNRIDIIRELIEEGYDFLVKFVVKLNLTKQQEIDIVIDETLTQRQIDKLKPSQLAHILRVKRDNDKYKSYGKNSRWSDDNKYSIKKSQVLEYIKLDDLIKEFSQMADEKLIPIKVGYNIAFLEIDKQKFLYDYLQANKKIKLNLSLAKAIKANKDKEFTIQLLDTIFDTLSVPKESKTNNKVYGSIVRRFLPNVPDEEAEQIVEQALQFYAQQLMQSVSNG